MSVLFVRSAAPPSCTSVRVCFLLAALMLPVLPAAPRATAAAPGDSGPSRARAEAAPVVGALGNPEAIDFAGNASFTSRALKTGLASWPGYLRAAHPNESLAGYLAAVRAALERGYRAAGFPDAAASVTLSAAGDRVAARIGEGPRFRLGEVRVEGAKAVPAADLVRALTSVPPAADPLARAAAWETAQRRAQERKAADERRLERTAAAAGVPAVKMPQIEVPALEGLMPPPAADEGGAPCFVAGEPASFTDGYLQQVRGAAGRFLAARGYPLAKVEVALEPDRATGLAHLRVRLDEGPPAVIGTIRVTGKPRSSPEEIVRCAGLAPGMPALPETIDRARLALWNSARFWVFDLDARPHDPPSGEVDVTIDVDENEALPRLGQPLPRAMAAAARLAGWLTAEASRRGFQLAVAHGALGVDIAVTLEGAAAVAEDGEGTLVGFVTGVDRHRLVAASRQTAAELTAERPETAVSFPMRLATGSNPDLRSSISFGIGAGSLDGGRTSAGGPRLVEPIVEVSPSFVCDLIAAAGEAGVRYEGPLIIVTSKEKVGLGLRFREDTGELVSLDLAFDVEEGRGAVPWRIALTMGGGGLAAIVSRVEGARARLPRPGDAPSLFSDVLLASPPLRRLLSESIPSITSNPARFEQGARLAERLARNLWHALFPVDQPRGEETFSVPVEPGVMDQPTLFAQLLGAGIHGLLGESWPADAWPTRLAREYFYILSGLTAHSDQALEDLSGDPQMGPLGSLLAAGVLRERSPAWSWRFARRAVDHGSVGAFGRDWRLLAGADSWLSRAVGDFLESLRDLDDEEAETLASGLPEAEAALVRAALADLRRKDGRPALEVAGPYIDQWWELRAVPGLEGRVAGLLDGGAAVDAVLVAATASGAPVSRRLAHLRRAVPDLFGWYPALSAAAGGAPRDAEAETLESMVRLTLVDREFRMRGGVVKGEYVDERVEDVVKNGYAGDRAAMEIALAGRGLTVGDLREAMRLRAVFGFMMEPVVRDVAPPAAEEVDRLLTAEVRAAGEVLHLRFVAVAKTPGELAARRAVAGGVRAAVLESGSTEGVCPRDGAEDALAPLCWDQRDVFRGGMHPALDAAAFALEEGGVSEVVETADDFFVLQLVSKGPKKPSEEDRQAAAEDLLARRRLEAIERHLARLRGEAVVRVLADPAPTAGNPAPGEGTVRFEFETLKVAGVGKTEVLAESMETGARRWSGGAQARCRSVQGGWVEWEFDVPSEGDYGIELLATRSPGYGQVQLSVDEADLGAPVELASPAVTQPSGARHLGERRLTGGRHVLRCTAMGRQPWSAGYDFGLDALDLIPAGSLQ